MKCKKCGADFEFWNSEVRAKFERGHVPLCLDCWSSVYGGTMRTSDATATWRNASMATRGRGAYTYICGECGVEKRESRLIRDRAARPRCPSCGSTKYEPKTSKASADIVERKDLGESRRDLQSGQDAGGSFIKG